MNTITEAYGFVRYSEPDGRFAVAKVSGPSVRPSVRFSDYKTVWCSFGNPQDSLHLMNYIERHRAPDGPDAWTILAALFPGAAERIEQIQHEIAKHNLIAAAQPAAPENESPRGTTVNLSWFDEETS